MKSSEWRETRNQRSRARLLRALPTHFPAPVLTCALNRPLIPPTPRLAIDTYWRAHPIRADRLARAMASRSGIPIDWVWRVSPDAKDEGLPSTFRTPPAPYRERRFRVGAGSCCICGQPVYRFGWHVDLWNRGSNKNSEWHSCCVVAWQLWNTPRDHMRVLKRLQKGRCAASGKRLLKSAEVDHRMPLFQVWRDHRGASWPLLLSFWGVPNLQVIDMEVHSEKCASEARGRASHSYHKARHPGDRSPELLGGEA